MAIAANFRKYAEAMALQLVLPFGKPVWNGSRPTTKLGRAIRAYITKAMKARGLVEYAVEKAIPQWWKDAQARARGLVKFLREHQLLLDLAEKTKELEKLPDVGEMYKGKPMTVAKHRRLTRLQIIAAEEASGDPELIKIAAWRRRGINA
ncbi:hypothetical protein [Comamonas resistens]|uniref:hypothetical protein n=1 Tax=Comamonas resistens TaxID=3046670 RepID=UPI0039BCE6C1